jgi:hypothetical protein
MKFFKKVITETYGLTWTLAGTSLVLITLSGDVQKYALWITGLAMFIHLVGALIKKEEK